MATKKNNNNFVVVFCDGRNIFGKLEEHVDECDFLKKEEKVIYTFE